MYYEDKKIVSEEDTDIRTKKLVLEIVSATEEAPAVTVEVEVTNWEYEVNSSEEPIDPTDARNNRAVYVVDAMYELFKTLDVHTNEISYTIQKFLSKIQGTEAKAIENCFGKFDNEMKISDWENKL